MNDLPELPPKFQTSLELARAKGERERAALSEIPQNQPHRILDATGRSRLILTLFFEYLKQARNAVRAGEWTVTQARRATEAAWPAICDFYASRELGADSDEAKPIRVTLWHCVLRIPTYRTQWDQHQAELAVLTETSADVPPTVSAAAVGETAPASLHDPYAMPANRNQSILDYMTAWKFNYRWEVAAQCGVTYSDLNKWKLDRGKVFAKGHSQKVGRIENELAKRPKSGI